MFAVRAHLADRGADLSAGQAVSPARRPDCCGDVCAVSVQYRDDAGISPTSILRCFSRCCRCLRFYRGCAPGALPAAYLLLGALAGCLLLISEYAHSSSLVTQIALAVYTVTICIDFVKDRKRIVQALCVLAACLLTLYGVKAAVRSGFAFTQGYRWEIDGAVLVSGICVYGTGTGDGRAAGYAGEDRVYPDAARRENAAILGAYQRPDPR